MLLRKEKSVPFNIQPREDLAATFAYDLSGDIGQEP